MKNRKNWIIAFFGASLIVLLAAFAIYLIKIKNQKKQNWIIKENQKKQNWIIKENQKLRQFAREMFEKQKQLDDTVIQRKVKDLKKAGINPILAARYFLK